MLVSDTWDTFVNSLSINLISPIIAQPFNLPSPINTHPRNNLTPSREITSDYSDFMRIPEIQQTQHSCIDATLLTTKIWLAA